MSDNKRENIFLQIYHTWLLEGKLALMDIGVLIFMIVLPIAYPIVYSAIYDPELVRDIPVVVVDDSRSVESRRYVQLLDATENVRVAGYAADMQEARRALNEKRCYGIIHFDSDFGKQVARSEQAHIEMYSDAGVLIRYKNILTALTSVTSTGMSKSSTKIVPFKMIPVGNTAMGLATAILPGILVIILQQAFVLAIAMVCATRRDQRKLNGGIDPRGEVNANAVCSVIGRALFYISIMLPASVFLLHVVPWMFSFPMAGTVQDKMLMVVPYTVAIVFFALTLQVFVREREATFPVLVVTSLFVLFLSGTSWPRYAMNGFWTLIGDCFPSTWGVQGLTAIANMGATISEQSQAFNALWILAGIYFILAVLVKRFIDR